MDLWVLIISGDANQSECGTIDELHMWVRVGIGANCGFGSEWVWVWVCKF